jgi:hypothetical protein
MKTTSLLASKKTGKSCSFSFVIPPWEVLQPPRHDAHWSQLELVSFAIICASRSLESCYKQHAWDCLVHRHGRAAVPLGSLVERDFASLALHPACA